MAIDNFGESKGYRWLSNFYSCDVEYEGKVYPSTEHAYQAAKTTNETHREMIRLCDTFGKAKRLGQQVEIRPEWDSLDAVTCRPFKVNVMYHICRQKFFNDVGLGDKLLATRDEHLIEGNTWNDRFWGVCNGKGLNWLGRILMDIREELRLARKGEE